MRKVNDIKIPKGFFNKLKYKISLPTFKCKYCNKNVLWTFNNIIKYEK